MTTKKPSSDSVRIRVLVDNEAKNDFVAEYGLSMWIEADGQRILFDTGQGKSLLANAERFGIDLSTADHIVISHGHYDHVGGLTLALAHAPDAKIHCHPSWIKKRYAIRNDTPKSIGIQDEVRDCIESLQSRQFQDAVKPVRVSPRIGLTGEVPRKTTYEDTGGPFFLDPEGVEVDRLEDDMGLWIETDQGLVICVGCSHSGVINIVNYIRSLYPKSMPVRALLGGFHLMEASRERIEATVTALKELEIPLLMPCHCTGAPVIKEIGDRLGASVVRGGAGTELVFE